MFLSTVYERIIHKSGKRMISDVIFEIYCLLLPGEEDLRQKTTKMMRDVMYPNKGPPSAAPTMIPGIESTRSIELLCLHSV